MELLSQDFGGSHHHGRVPAFERHQRSRGRHQRLARAHVALEQSAHGHCPAHVLSDLAQYPVLGLCWPKPESRQERAHERIVALAGQGGSLRFQIEAAALDLELQRDELVEREALPAPFRIGVGDRKMQIPDRLRPRRPLLGEQRYFLLAVRGGCPARPAGFGQQVRIRFRDALAEGFQRVPGNPPPRPLGESVSQAVEGHPTAHVQAGFFG